MYRSAGETGEMLGYLRLPDGAVITSVVCVTSDTDTTYGGNVSLVYGFPNSNNPCGLSVAFPSGSNDISVITVPGGHLCADPVDTDVTSPDYRSYLLSVTISGEAGIGVMYKRCHVDFNLP
jgi:hypothetical protein